MVSVESPAVEGQRAPEFRALFEAESSYVWRTLRRLGVPDRDLEDVAHEVFIIVHRRLEDFDASRPLRPWLFGISTRVAAAYRRSARNRHEVIDGAAETADPAPAADEMVEQSEARALVRRALDAIDEERRPVFIMHDLDGYPMSEIAAALEIPANTGYSRLRLARAEFAGAVERARLRESKR